MSKLQDFLATVGKSDKELLKGALKDARVEEPQLSTGFLCLDEMLGGGIRAGKYVELYGLESVGKSYLALCLMRQCQQQWGRPVAFLDFEHTWSTERAQQLGVDLSEDMLHVWTPPTQESAYNLMNLALRADTEEGVYGLIVVDSISGMPALYETENKIEKNTMASQARNHSQGLRVITSGMRKTIIVLINQIRDNMSMYGAPTTTSGGRAVKHYAHYRLEMTKQYVQGEAEVWDDTKGALVSTGKKRLGHEIKVRLAKNKQGIPETSAELYFDYEQGQVDPEEDLKRYLMHSKLIWREGTTYWWINGVDKKLYGKNSVVKYLRENPEERERLLEESRSQVAHAGVPEGSGVS